MVNNSIKALRKRIYKVMRGQMRGEKTWWKHCFMNMHLKKQ